MKVAVVGGGLAGLTAAYFLSKNNVEVTVFEKENSLGGLAGCFKNPNWNWFLEKYYHHFFVSDKEVFELAEELNIGDKFSFKTQKSSVFVDGKTYRFDNPKSIFAFPKLNLIDKVRTGAVSVFLKINPFWKPLEKISAEIFIRKTMGENSFNVIWKPLLESKFGKDYKTIPASWFWTRIKKRSFKLGYFEGGNETLINALKEEILKYKGKILLNSGVDDIKKEGGTFKLTVKSKTFSQEFDRVITTLSPAMFAKFFPGEKENVNSNLESLGSLCLVLELKKSFFGDGTYWLSVNDSSYPFVAVVEHTNFMNKENYGNHAILYVGGYYPQNHRYFKMKKEDILKEFLPYLKKINQDFDCSLFTVSCSLFSDKYAQPVPGLNYSQTGILETKTKIPGLFWASLHHVYPEDRGVNYAIKLGKNIAHEILK